MKFNRKFNVQYFYKLLNYISKKVSTSTKITDVKIFICTCT